MVDARQDLRLGAEALDDLGLARQLGTDGLDRHLPVEHLVDGPVDGAHAAFADLLDDPVAADDSADHVAVSVRGDDSIAKGPSSGPILAIFALPGPCG